MTEIIVIIIINLSIITLSLIRMNFDSANKHILQDCINTNLH